MSEALQDQFEECEVMQEKEVVVEYGEETLIERAVNIEQVREEQNIQRYLDGEEKVYEIKKMDETKEVLEQQGQIRQRKIIDRKVNEKNVVVDIVQDEVVADIAQQEYVEAVIVQDEVVADIAQQEYVEAVIVQDEVVADIVQDEVVAVIVQDEVVADIVQDEVVADIVQDEVVADIAQQEYVEAVIVQDEVVADIVQDEVVADIVQDEVVADIAQQEYVEAVIVQDEVVADIVQDEVVADIVQDEVVADIVQDEVVADIVQDEVVADIAQQEYVEAVIVQDEVVADIVQDEVVAVIVQDEVVADIVQDEVVADIVQDEVVADIAQQEYVEAVIVQDEVVADIVQDEVVADIAQQEYVEAVIVQDKVVADIVQDEVVADIAQQEYVEAVIVQDEVVADIVQDEVVADIAQQEYVEAVIVQDEVVADIVQDEVVADIVQDEVVAVIVQDEVVADIVQDEVVADVVQDEVVADIAQQEYVEAAIVQDEVILQPHLYTPLPVVIDPISIPFNPIIQSVIPNDFNHHHSLLKHHPDQAVVAFAEIQAKQQQEYQEQEFISQNAMNALCSPLLPGQFAFPVPESNYVAQEELNREIQTERFQLQPKRIEYQVFQETKFADYQAEKQIKVAKRQLQNIGVVNQFEVEKEYVYNPPQFIEIQNNEIQEEERTIDRSLEKAILSQERQSREKQALQRAQLQRQAQVFKLKPQKIVQTQINVYNQPVNLDKFTVENAVAYKDPSIVLESAIYYSQFFEWKQGLASLSTTELKFPDKSTRTSDVNKLKLTKEAGVNNSRKIKINYFTQFYIFSVDSKEFVNDLPLHYYWFAKIINEKMHLKGCDINNPYLPEKVNTNINVKNQLIDGILYKKSQYFGKWELRYIAITSSGLFSFKDQTGGETFSIKKDTAAELWTRFQVYERMLVIKIHHSNRKTEFGIPIVDYCVEGANNWLYAFYRLVYGQ